MMGEILQSEVEDHKKSAPSKGFQSQIMSEIPKSEVEDHKKSAPSKGFQSQIMSEIPEPKKYLYFS